MPIHVHFLFNVCAGRKIKYVLQSFVGLFVTFVTWAPRKSLGCHIDRRIAKTRLCPLLSIFPIFLLSSHSKPPQSHDIKENINYRKQPRPGLPLRRFFSPRREPGHARLQKRPCCQGSRGKISEGKASLRAKITVLDEACDLADLKSVRAYAGALVKKLDGSKLDALVLNAGLGGTPVYTITVSPFVNCIATRLINLFEASVAIAFAGRRVRQDLSKQPLGTLSPHNTSSPASCQERPCGFSVFGST